MNKYLYLARSPFALLSDVRPARRSATRLQWGGTAARPAPCIASRQTCSKTQMVPAQGIANQKGFSLLAAIFLLIILTGLAFFLVSIATMNQVGSALDIQGSKAYQAARSGIEWGAYQALTPASPPACPATTLTFAGTTLQDFSTAVTCTLSSVDEQGTTINIYQFTATACNQAPCPSGSPGQGYVERQLTLVVGR